MRVAAERLNVSKGRLTFRKMLDKSLDSNSFDQFYYRVSIVVGIPGDCATAGKFPLYHETIAADGGTTTVLGDTGVPGEHSEYNASGYAQSGRPPYREERPVVVGFGPAGMFAALELIEHGLMPVIFERGKRIDDRSRDVQRFILDRELDPESNIQFGEGGAGSYSDGKLFSRVNNSAYANKVLETFIRFGAPEEIRYVRKPHVGTDVLCGIVKNIRNYLLERGGEIHYGSRMTDILISGGKIRGIVINGEIEHHASIVYLAIGHSARDTFKMIHGRGVVGEQKPVSVGVRIEHPVTVINLMRYGDKYKDFKGIGAAGYSLTYTDRNGGRGVYTFCMCPGGEVINASSENGMTVVNGMSYSSRSSAYSNAAIVVTCHRSDYGSDDPLAGIEFQKRIERKTFEAGGGSWRVPAQNLVDFLDGTTSRRLNSNSYKMGATAADMREIFPVFVSEALTTAFKKWKLDYPLFVSDHAILLGAETRTSSPVRFTRNGACESVSVKNLYPIGEGSGYAGGITSSAIDAIKAVEKSLCGMGRHKKVQGRGLS